MRKTILAVLMVVMIATPCMGQEIEPDGIFTLNGTLWWELSLFNLGGGYQIHYGFYQENVYYIGNRCSIIESASYINLLVLSFFNKPFSGGFSLHGIMQPLGIGMALYISESESKTISFDISLLIKVENFWTPPQDCEPMD